MEFFFVFGKWYIKKTLTPMSCKVVGKISLLVLSVLIGLSRLNNLRFA